METGKLTSGFCDKVRKPGRYSDGGGLYLLVKPDGRKTWVFRFRDRVTSKQQDMGLGPFGPHDVTLAAARIEAGKWRAMLRESPPRNPIEVRRQALQDAKLAHARRLTFGQCAERYIEAHKASWKNAKHRAQWSATLDTYAVNLKPLPVADIDTALVIKCLEPIWSEKTETATRVRQRIEAVLDWATARRFREGENPARWRGHLDKLLPKPTKLKNVQHRAALPYAEVGAFVAELRTRNSLAARALELQILTATRPGEVIGSTWNEFDLAGKTWTIPAGRMKARKEHTIPLAPRALRILEALPHACDFVFPGPTLKKGMTTAACMKLIKEIRQNITAHGMRSTFRDWAAEQTGYPREVIEHALAHQLKDKAEAAYFRSDLLAKRARLMRDWARYCETIPAAGKVTPIRSEAHS
jgi:integrase